MTDWNAIKETGKEPDTLAKVIDTIENALLPMMRSMMPEPNEEQYNLIVDAVYDIRIRSISLWKLGWLGRGNNGDDDTS